MLTSYAKHGFNDLAYGRLKELVTSSSLLLKLSKGYVGGFLKGWASGRNLYVTITDAERNLEICKITDIIGDNLTVARGQDGTVAQNWPAGSLISQRLVAANLGRFDQMGEYRSITYNPNGVLSANYPGEKVYETGGDACQVRWWINSETNKWRLLAGDICVWEDYDADGYVYTVYEDYGGDNADGYVKNSNAVWVTCRDAVTGDAHDDTLASEDKAMSALHTTSGGSHFDVYRSFLYFDLSGAMAGITAVELHIAIRGSGTLIIQEGTQADPLSNADYDAFTGVSLGGYVSSLPASYTAIFTTLNSDGLTYIQGIATAEGIAKLCLREYAFDFMGVEPGWLGGGVMGLAYTESLTEAYRPFLRLRYD